MGSRYKFTEDCPKCGKIIECYYAPSSCFITVTCPYCKTEFKIVIDFVLSEIKNEKEKKEWYECHDCYLNEEATDVGNNN